MSNTQNFKKTKRGRYVMPENGDVIRFKSSGLVMKEEEENRKCPSCSFCDNKIFKHPWLQKACEQYPSHCDLSVLPRMVIVHSAPYNSSVTVNESPDAAPPSLSVPASHLTLFNPGCRRDSSHETQRDDWAFERKRAFRYHGSRMSSINGNNYFEQPLDCVLNDVHDQLAAEGLREPRIRETNVHMERGNRLEPIAKSLYNIESGHKMVDLHDRVIFSRSDVLDGLMGFTPDGITYCGILVEIKCPARKPTPSKVLKSYSDQVQAGMCVLGLHKSVLYQYTETFGTLSTEVVHDPSWLKTTEENVQWYTEEFDRQYMARKYLLMTL